MSGNLIIFSIDDIKDLKLFFHIFFILNVVVVINNKPLQLALINNGNKLIKKFQ